MIRIALACSFGLSLAVAQAQDPLLETIDALAEEGRCVEALLLLERARIPRVARAGRRALCAARAGRPELVVADVATALRSPRDPWVRANRESLLAALREAAGEPPGPPVVVGAPTPVPPPPAPAPVRPVPSRPEPRTARAPAPPSPPSAAVAVASPSPPPPESASRLARPAPTPRLVAELSPTAIRIEPNPYRHGSNGPMVRGHAGAPMNSRDVAANPYR